MSAPTNRRGILKGLAAFVAGSSAAATTAAHAAHTHPDAELLEAGRELSRAEKAFFDACAALSAARRAAQKDHGPVPAALAHTEEEHFLIRRVGKFGWFGDRLRPHAIPRPQVEGRWVNPADAWSAYGLRVAIKEAVPCLGRGGRTPHLIRRWRGLLPVAEDYNRRCEAARARHRIGELRNAEEAADRAFKAARAAVERIPAKTPEGLAAHLALYKRQSLDNLPDGWRHLIISAANVAGVDCSSGRIGGDA